MSAHPCTYLKVCCSPLLLRCTSTSHSPHLHVQHCPLLHAYPYCNPAHSYIHTAHSTRFCLSETEKFSSTVKSLVEILSQQSQKIEEEKLLVSEYSSACSLFADSMPAQSRAVRSIFTRVLTYMWMMHSYIYLQLHYICNRCVYYGDEYLVCALCMQMNVDVYTS